MFVVASVALCDSHSVILEHAFLPKRHLLRKSHIVERRGLVFRDEQVVS